MANDTSFDIELAEGFLVMPVKLHLSLQGPSPDAEMPHVSFRHVNGVRAWVYHCLTREDPVFASEMHGDTWPKPITASPLRWQEDRWLLEFSVLLDEIAPYLLRGISDGEQRLMLGREEFTIIDVQSDAQCTFDELRHGDDNAAILRMAFLTPTAHQQTLTVQDAEGVLRKQRKVIPLPDPALAVTSWWHKWNYLMDYMQQERIPESFRDYLPLLVVARFSGGTHSVMLDGARPFIGFVGDIVVKMLAPSLAPPDFRQHLHTLARFAEYCGTGVDTMRGMGQTRVSPA